MWRENGLQLKLIVAIVCLAFIGPAFAAAQTTTEDGGLNGVVFKKDKETPLKKAKVRLKAIEKRWGGRTYTSQPSDDNGVFTLTGIPEGTYKVILITKGGRKLKTRTVVKIQAGKMLDRDFHVKARKGFFGNWVPCGISFALIGLLFLL